MKTGKMCVIVVPMYRLEMDAFEEISWTQLHRILEKHPICIAGPASLAERLEARYHVPVKGFADENFQSVASYSRMMLSEEFYHRFESYEYMLIYQLDAFVFSDRLAEFCQMGYDYIGAPWPYWITVGRRLLRKRVGNGGFSLRNVSSAIRVLLQKENVFRTLEKEEQEYCLSFEDVFWAYCGTIPELGFTIPPAIVAGRFSLENVNRPTSKRFQHLPFGFHDGSHFNLEMWCPALESFGYIVPKLSTEQETYTEKRKKVLLSYLMERIRRQQDFGYYQERMEWLRHRGIRYVLWGMGRYGEACLRLFAFAPALLSAIYDKGKAGSSVLVGGKKFFVQNPEITLPKDGIFLISTMKYSSEIRENLLHHGLRENEDFIDLWTFFMRILVQK